MQRAKELRNLSSEHHRALVIAKKARNAAGGSSTTNTWLEIERLYADELERHFRTEEVYFIPALERLGMHELVSRLTREHKDLRSFFRSNPSRDTEALLRFGTLLAQHVRFEERELFNVVQESFTPQELASIEKGIED